MTEASFVHRGVGGEITIPGSKSYTQRYILLSAFSGIPVTLSNVSDSEDEAAAMRIAGSAGATVDHKGSTLKVNPDFRCPEEIDAGESATSLRISLALLSARRCRTRIHVTESLKGRDSLPLVSELENHGALITGTDYGFMLDASAFTPGDMAVTGSFSSQFTTALVLMQPLMMADTGKVTVNGMQVSGGYIDITVECLENLGIKVTRDKSSYIISGTLRAPDRALQAETDMSSLSVFLLLAVLASENGITIHEVNSSGKQPDHAFVGILQEAGFNVAADWKLGQVKAGKGYGGHVTVDADITPDLCIIASVLGIFSPSGVTVVNPERLSGKESDRKQAMIELCRSFGAVVTEYTDRIEIHPSGSPVQPDTISFSDHRMVMAAAIAAITSGSGTVVGNIDSVKKSFPAFTRTLGEVGVTICST